MLTQAKSSTAFKGSLRKRSTRCTPSRNAVVEFGNGGTVDDVGRSKLHRRTTRLRCASTRRGLTHIDDRIRSNGERSSAVSSGGSVESSERAACATADNGDGRNGAGGTVGDRQRAVRFAPRRRLGAYPKQLPSSCRPTGGRAAPPPCCSLTLLISPYAPVFSYQRENRSTIPRSDLGRMRLTGAGGTVRPIPVSHPRRASAWTRRPLVGRRFIMYGRVPVTHGVRCTAPLSRGPAFTEPAERGRERRDRVRPERGTTRSTAGMSARLQHHSRWPTTFS
jgi:hypothetical protein